MGTCTCMEPHALIHSRTHAHTHAHIHTHTHKHTHTHTHTYIYIYKLTHSLSRLLAYSLNHSSIHSLTEISKCILGYSPYVGAVDAVKRVRLRQGFIMTDILITCITMKAYS